jgi:hypothetical protein
MRRRYRNFHPFSAVREKKKKKKGKTRGVSYAIQWIDRSEVQPIINRPPAKKNDPIIIDTSRASGTGLPLFAMRRLT